MPFRFHLLSLVHLPQSATYLSCAFTQKNRKLAKMLTSLGHEVFFYGAEGSDVAEYCQSDRLHFIQTHTLHDIRRDYGDGDNRFQIGYDWRNTDFRHDFNLARRQSTVQFYAASIAAINAVKREDDFLLLSQGSYFKPVADTVKLFLTCEPGVGYRGSYAQYRAFESSYIQNFTYGSAHPYESINGSHYDRVIPNYFDPDDVEFSERKDDYFLFIGRMIKRKGIVIAAETCNALGAKLLIAGQGAHVTARGSLLPNTDPDFELEPGTWEYVGYADVATRKQLMAHARAVFAPTEYLETFGGVHIEAMLSGTPVITTNFGVYPGTVINGVNGFRADTLRDFVWAARHVGELSPAEVRRGAERYLMDNVRWDYAKWFDDLHQVYLSAQDAAVPGFHFLGAEPPWREQINW